MQVLGFKLAEEASLKVLTSEVVKSSEIEGEKLNPEAVRSSIARRLGIETGGLFLDKLVPSDKYVDGVVEMVIDATRNCDAHINTRAALWLACSTFSYRP